MWLTVNCSRVHKAGGAANFVARERVFPGKRSRFQWLGINQQQWVLIRGSLKAFVGTVNLDLLNNKLVRVYTNINNNSDVISFTELLPFTIILHYYPFLMLQLFVYVSIYYVMNSSLQTFFLPANIFSEQFLWCAITKYTFCSHHYSI